MIQKPIAISVIAVVGVAGILTLSVLAAISSTNQAFAAATTEPTTLTLQVHTSTKTLGKVSDMVPLTISGRLWTKDFSRAIPGATIKISCDGKECGTSDTDSNGHYSVSTSLNAICTVGICTHSTNTIKASTLKVPEGYEESEASMTIQLCKDLVHATWSFCGPTTK